MKTKTPSPSALVNLRLLVAILLCSASVFLAVAGVAQSQQKPSQAPWPSLAAQLSQEYMGRKVEPGSALEALIRENQDFSLLREDEKSDKRNLPAWMRVWWRKAHPEAEYSAEDPTGGYPHVLKEILEWMMTHQDLKAGPGVDEKVSAASETDPDATSGPDFRVSGSQAAARSESDIRVNFFDNSKILSASNNIASGGRQGVYYSVDSGATWNNTLLPLTASDTTHSDPTVDWTSDSRGWSSTLGIQGGSLRLRNYVSTDNGATWTFEATASGTQTNVDKQMVWVDHSASSPFKDQMYAIWHNGSPAFMNRRTAGPTGTWLAAPIQVSSTESTGTAIGSDVKTNSAGDVFGAWPTTTSSKIFLVKSTNGGATYSAPVQIAPTYDTYDIGVPSFAGRRALLYVTLGAFKASGKDNVYAIWMDLSGNIGCTAPANEPGTNAASTCKTRIWFARSTNGGATWSTPVKINDQPGLNDQFNPWLAVDETSGGVGIMYYDTVGDSTRKTTNVWYQSSGNDGATWSAPLKVTTAATDETIAGADSGNQYGDYNGMSAIANSFFPSWTDRRTGGKEEVWSVKITDTFVPTPNVVGSTSAVNVGGCSNQPARNLNPGQLATVSLCVANNGTLDATNVVGTLQESGGVVSPSGPQSFGTLPAGGAATCRTFKFTPTVTCGSPVTATLQLQDATTSYGSATYTFTTGVANTTFVENFDAVTAPALPAGWVATNATGAAPLWVTTTATPHTPPNAAFVDDPATISDKRLETPAFTVSSAAAQVSFRNSYVFEDTATLYDGGVLEVSSPNINAGAYTDITNAAVGGSFVSGGYNGTLSTGFSNPIGGRAAWGGNSGGYISSVANLGPNVAGQTIKLRFRMGSDSSTASTGWRIDTLSIQAGSICSPLPLSAVSRKIHGNQGAFEVPLPVGGRPGIEPRSGGPSGDHQVVLNFANPITATNAVVTDGSGAVSSVNVSGSTAVVNMTGVGNAQTSTVTLNGVSDGTNTGCVNIPMATLLGDTNGDAIVNAGDALQTRGRSGQTTDATNYRSDVNTDGGVSAGDAVIVRSRAGTSLPTP